MVPVQERKIELLYLRDVFERVEVVPYEDGPDKREVLGRIQGEVGGDPAEVWVIGDRPQGEIRDGNALGATTIRVRRGEFAALDAASADEEADLTVDDLRDLVGLL